MRSAAPALLIFDCDGTLVDSEILGADALSAYASEYGIVISAGQALTRFKGWKLDDCVSELGRMGGVTLPPGFVSELRRRIALLLRSSLQPIAGAAQLLQSLQSRMQPFCLASNAPREKIELCLGVTGLLPYFGAHIFSAYEVGSWKPEPGLFLHAAASMGVAAADCAVVEDSVFGMRAGLAAGMTVFGLQTGVRDPALPSGVRVVTSLAELQQCLQGQGQGFERAGLNVLL